MIAVHDEPLFFILELPVTADREVSVVPGILREAHEIEKADHLLTAWDTFTNDTPGQSERYDYKGKSVYDLPEELKEWGIYLAETRTE